MPAHNRRLKQITFSLGPVLEAGAAIEFQCQVQSWQLVNNTADGDLMYTFCPDGEFREEADDDYALEMTFFSDWRSDGISDFLWTNDGAVVDFTLDHHPDIEDEHVQWTGQVKIKAPSVGGEARATETTEVTLLCIGKPLYERVEADAS